jgi:hypothetical protein
VDDDALARLDDIPGCPVQFRAYVEGVDVRVNVIGRQVFQMRPVTWELTPEPGASVNCSSECLLG